jgi:hypothetical protein
MSYLARNVPNEFIEFVGGFVIETEAAVGRKPPFITHGAHIAMYVQLAREMFNASYDRRGNEGHDGLLEGGARRMIETFGEMYWRDGGAYMDKHQKDMALRMVLGLVDHKPYPLQCVVEYELRERRDAAFLASYYREPWAGEFGEDGYVSEHPMRTFARYLDYLDDIKGVDVDEYKANLQQKRHVLSWRRVGLGFIPQENWQPRFRYPASVSQALEEHRDKS